MKLRCQAGFAWNGSEIVSCRFTRLGFALVVVAERSVTLLQGLLDALALILLSGSVELICEAHVARSLVIASEGRGGLIIGGESAVELVLAGALVEVEAALFIGLDVGLVPFCTFVHVGWNSATVIVVSKAFGAVRRDGDRLSFGVNSAESVVLTAVVIATLEEGTGDGGGKGEDLLLAHHGERGGWI